VVVLNSMEERERTSIPGAGEGADEELANGVAVPTVDGERRMPLLPASLAADL
jgi:hypothetical protein